MFTLDGFNGLHSLSSTTAETIRNILNNVISRSDLAIQKCQTKKCCQYCKDM